MTHSQLAVVAMLTPLLTFGISIVFFRRKHLYSAATVILGGILSLYAVSKLLMDYDGEPELITWRWLSIGGIDISVGALLDGRSLLMAIIVGVITLAVMIYSLGYMAHDDGKGRFFASLALFELSMMAFAFAPNLLQAFVFWELVGLASFLLIGFWYEKPSAVAAAKKAFVMTRIGDIGMLIGLIWLFMATGTLETLPIIHAFTSSSLPFGMHQSEVEFIAFLLFLGVMGKSAQFPLHTWLPDAMEGPTPVSALLHSATMVAAGVFVYARFHELFISAHAVSIMVVAIATFTALMSSTMAMAAWDIKKVLAYSSISQLGFMLMALGAGNLFAGLFHLMTHAFFKALLFLSAGAYIHHFGTNDMVAIGRAGGRRMTWTSVGLVIGGLALAGIPIFAGFWSKEAILGTLGKPGYGLYLAGAYVAAAMTAYYTFRMLFLVLRPSPESRATVVQEPEAHEHKEETHSDAPWSMRAPIMVLSFGALVLGMPAVSEPLEKLLHWEEVHHGHWWGIAIAMTFVLGGAAWAWLDFGLKNSRQMGILSYYPRIQTFFQKGWYFDELYQKTAVALSEFLAHWTFELENKGIDPLGDRLADATQATGAWTSKSHTGRLPIYIAVAILVLAGASIFVTLN